MINESLPYTNWICTHMRPYTLIIGHRLFLSRFPKLGNSWSRSLPVNNVYLLRINKYAEKIQRKQRVILSAQTRTHSKVSLLRAVRYIDEKFLFLSLRSTITRHVFSYKYFGQNRLVLVQNVAQCVFKVTFARMWFYIFSVKTDTTAIKNPFFLLIVSKIEYWSDRKRPNLFLFYLSSEVQWLRVCFIECTTKIIPFFVSSLWHYTIAT